MRKAILVSLGAAALALGLSNPAQAATFMSITDSSGGSVSCSNPPAGCAAQFTVAGNIISFTGTVGQYAVNISSENSNNPGNSVIASMSSSTLDTARNTFTGAATLTILISQSGFTAPASSIATLGNAGSVSDAATVAGDSYSVQSWVDTSNTLHTTMPVSGTATNGPCSITATGGNIGSASCTGAGASPGNGQLVGFSNAVPFSLTQVVTFTILPTSTTNDRITATGTTTITAVPEPASMLLLGTGLIGLAARARRSLRKS